MKHRVWLVLLVVCSLVVLLGMDEPSNAHAQSTTSEQLIITTDPPEGGIVEIDPPKDNYGFLDVVTLTPVASTGWRFSHWDGPDKNLCEDGSVMILFVNMKIECTAVFKNNFYIFASVDPHDSGNWIEYDPPMEIGDFPLPLPKGYPVGTEVKLIPHSVGDYYFDYWTGPDADECDKPVTVVPNYNLKCTAKFVELPPIPPDLHRWMTDIAPEIGDRRLMDVVLPGSHDSGTYAFGQSSGYTNPSSGWDIPEDLLPLIGTVRKSIYVGWSKTQTGTIHWQLNAGARYFDLRFFEHEEDLYIYHGEVRGANNYAAIFQQIEDFLNEDYHEKEIIILDFTTWSVTNEARYREFLDEFLSRFRDEMIPGAYEQATLDEIWALPGQPQLVVRFRGLKETWFKDDDGFPETDVEDFQRFWLQYPSDKQDWSMCRPWANAQQETVLFDYVQKEMNCPCCGESAGNEIDYNRSEQLFMLQGLINPDKPGKMIKCGLRKQVDDWLKDFKWYCDIPIVGSETCNTIDDWLSLIGCPDEDDWENAPKNMYELAIGTTDPGDATPKVTGWVSEWWQGCNNDTRDNLNIIGVDFLEADDFVVVTESIMINEVTEYNDPPAFTELDDKTSKEGDVVQLAEKFSDDDGCDYHVASVKWGDDTEWEKATINTTDKSINSDHVYADDGTYTVDVCVKDGPNPLPSVPFINEIHYDNDGDDSDEGVEIAGAANTDLTGWQLALYSYDAAQGQHLQYHEEALDSFGPIPDLYDGYGMVTVPLAGLHDDGPAGIALVNTKGDVSQFLCYEGYFVADDGLAKNYTCSDIGVSETGTKTAGQSLQLSGEGTLYGDYVWNWNAPAAATFGAINSDQTFVPYEYFYSETCDTFQVSVENVPPTVNAGPDDTLDESVTFSLPPATFNDKGTLDEHTATINWDEVFPHDPENTVEGSVTESPFGPPGSTSGANGTVSGSYKYGDNSIYNVEVCVTDDHATTCDQVMVTVNNVNPTVDFDKSAAITFAGGQAFLARRGVEQTFNSDAEDVGSDDLTFDWSFPPSIFGSTTTYLNNAASIDLAHSPVGVFPFDASDTNKTTFSVPGVYEAVIDITDDDGGQASDSLPMLMTDSRECTAVRPTWDHQFGAGGKQTIDDRRLQGYLDVIRFASAYFDDGNLLDLDDAAAIFNAKGSGVDLLKQHALSAWLNFASGGVLWDQAIPQIDRPFHEVIGEIDVVLLNPSATKKDLVDAQKDALKINGLNPAESSCNDPGAP